MRFHLDKVFKADQRVQYIDDTGIAANDAEQLIKNLRAMFNFNQMAGLKLTMHARNFGATKLIVWDVPSLPMG